MREDETARCTLSSCGIKRIALACMIVDHTGAALFPQAAAMRCVGRLAFPLYTFLTAEACRHTHSREKHLALLGLFALLSEIPYDLAFWERVSFLDLTNVFYTLFFSSACIYIAEKLKGQSGRTVILTVLTAVACCAGEGLLLLFGPEAYWPTLTLLFIYLLGMLATFAFLLKERWDIPNRPSITDKTAALAAAAPVLLLAGFIKCDYGSFGVLLPLLLYLAERSRSRIIILAGALAVYYGKDIFAYGVFDPMSLAFLIFAIASVPILLLYNGQRGNGGKMFYYWAYPMHISVIAALIHLT